MSNKIYLKNGIVHELTKDEIKILLIAVYYFNKCSLPYCSEERENEYLKSLETLKALFNNLI